MPFDPEAFFEDADKQLVSGPTWQAAGQELELIAYIDVGGITSPDVRLRAMAELHYPDARVLLQIERTEGAGNLRPLARIEWRPARGHTNRRLGPNKRLHYKRIPGSHVHGFKMNWNATAGEPWGPNLPIADEPQQDLNSYMALLATASVEFRIQNMADVPAPPWEPLLGLS
jgi:hypothetical protein